MPISRSNHPNNGNYLFSVTYAGIETEIIGKLQIVTKVKQNCAIWVANAIVVNWLESKNLQKNIKELQ